jgi:hypothetical protein
LGIPSLWMQIPLLRRDRLDRLNGCATDGLDPVLTALLSYEHLRGELKRWGSPQICAGVVVSSKVVARATIADRLHTTVDGRGLRFHNLVPCVNDWDTGGTSLQTGSGYTLCVQTRAASLHTAVRAACGHPGASMKCDACGELEGLSHIFQRCCRAARPIERRHYGIVNYAKKPCAVRVIRCWSSRRYPRLRGSGDQTLLSIPQVSGPKRSTSR